MIHGQALQNGQTVKTDDARLRMWAKPQGLPQAKVEHGCTVCFFIEMYEKVMIPEKKHTFFPFLLLKSLASETDTVRG